MSGILKASSGPPVSIEIGSNRSGDNNSDAPDRPDLRPGASNNPNHGTTAGCGVVRNGKPTIAAGQKLATRDRFYDPCAFGLPARGYYGNLGRDTVIGPGVANFDFSLVKNFHVTERNLIAFRAEFFNLFNRANFGLPARFALTSSGAPAGNAGAIQSLTTSARQIQFGLRYSF